MTENHTIRLFEEKDLHQVVNINWTCLPENYDDSFFLELYYNFPKTFIVATIGEKIVGYLMCRVEIGFSEIKRLGIVKKGHIVSIAVLPEYRNKGIGYALVTQALNGVKAYNVSEIYLEVRISNDVAINLYKKLEFKPIKTLNGYYKDGESAHLMARLVSS